MKNDSEQIEGEKGVYHITTSGLSLRQPIQRILFATDSFSDFKDCLELVRSRGIEVRQVRDGRSCVDEALRGKESGKPFDVIVVSVDLPVLDGFSTAMLLRDNDCARVIISMDSTEHYIQEEESVQAGCDLHWHAESLPGDLASLIGASAR